MAELARLRIAVDSTSAKTAERDLEGLASAAGNTGRAVDAMIASQNRMVTAMQSAHKPTLDAVRYLDSLNRELQTVGMSSLQIKAMEIKMAAAAAPTAELAREIRNVGAELIRAERNAASTTPTIGGMGDSSKLASHHVQNLAFQLQDVAVGLASGQRPMTVFMQQGTQIAGIMTQAGLGVTGFVGAVISMVAPFAPAIIAVGALSAAIGIMADDMNKNSKVAITWGDVLLGAFDAVKAALGRGVDAAFRALGTTSEEAWQAVVDATGRAINFVIGAVVALPRAIYAAWGQIPAGVADIFLSAGNAAIDALNSALSALGLKTVPRLSNEFAGAGAQLGNTIATSMADSMSRNWLGDAAAAISPYASARARKRVEDDAKEAGKSAGKEIVDSIAEYINGNTAKALGELGKDFKFDDSMLNNAGKQLEAMVNRGGEAFRTSMEKNLDTFTNTMKDVAGILGGSLDSGINRLADVLRREFPVFANDIGKMFSGIGRSIDRVLSGIGTSLGQLGGGASVGSAIGSIMGGNKGAQIGSAIGGAAGSFFGPVGSIVGSVLGNLVGGLFKGKNNFVDVMLSATGTGRVFNQRGGAQSLQVGSQLGGAFSQQLNAIATALGGTVGGNQSFGSIGFSGEQFYFNPTGGDFKAYGNMRFATAEEAIAAAIKNAVSKGAFEGLSESSKEILKGLAGLSTEEIMKALEKVNLARGMLTDAYNREAAAITNTLDKFKALTFNLQSFRASLAEQLMTAEEIYNAARGKFEEISKAAISGNEDAIAELVGVSQKYLDAARNFLTPEEYNREIENVMKAVDLAIVQTKTMEEYAQSQLDALNKSVEGLIKVDESVISVKDAIDNLKAVMSGFIDRTTTSGLVNVGSYTGDNGGDFYASDIQPFANGGMHSGGLRIVGENGPELEATGPSRIYNANQTADILGGSLTTANQIAALRDEMRASLYAIAKNTGKTANQLVRWDGDGLPTARNY